MKEWQFNFLLKNKQQSLLGQRFESTENKNNNSTCSQTKVSEFILKKMLQ